MIEMRSGYKTEMALMFSVDGEALRALEQPEAESDTHAD